MMSELGTRWEDTHARPGRLDSQAAVITGGGRGIGEAVARAFADAGSGVVLAARSLSEIEAVAASINDAGGRAYAVACDVTREEDVAKLYDRALELLGPINILVNNAGIALSSLVQKTTLEEWNRILAVNATGAFLCTRAFLPAMQERNFGRIVNVASVAGLTGARYIAAYAASKHAVIGMTRAVAADLAGSGVTINAVCPSFVDTPMTDQTVSNVAARTGKSREDALAAVLATGHQPRLVTPAEVAHAVLSLCDVNASAINGESLVVDSGGLLR